jgi:Helix-turn-helix domain
MQLSHKCVVKADALVMRATLLSGLERLLKESKLTRAQAAKALGITQARVPDSRALRPDRLTGRAANYGDCEGAFGLNGFVPRLHSESILRR